MLKDTENNIRKLVETLKKTGKTWLATCIEQNWQKTALGYSKELNTYSPIQSMEPEMRDAFRKELERLEVENVETVLKSLEKRRILQTAPHLGATESPRMLCINWLGSLGVPDDEYYIVGMYSGIPFSNNSRPGRINRVNDSVNLFPSSMQDDTVFRSIIPEKLMESLKTLPEKIKKLLPEAKLDDSYTKWALQTCGNIEKKILRKNNLIYLDINEVVTNYLDAVREKKDHPMNKIKELSEPNLFFAFAPLLLNHFKCFGSFRQVEYLPEYQKRLTKIKFIQDFEIEKVPTANLTTGEFIEKLFPADIVLGEKFNPNENILFGELLLNMKDTLLIEKK